MIIVDLFICYTFSRKSVQMHQSEHAHFHQEKHPQQYMTFPTVTQWWTFFAVQVLLLKEL